MTPGVEPVGNELPEAHSRLLTLEHDRVARVLQAAIEQGVQRDDPMVIIVAQLYSRLGIGLARARWTPSELQSELRLATEEGRKPTVVEAFCGDDMVSTSSQADRICRGEVLGALRERQSKNPRR